jgi:FkbM family methyltransferase
MISIKYKNPYSVKKNILIQLYCFFDNRRFARPWHYIHYSLALIFKRVAFELVKQKVRWQTSGNYSGRAFNMRSTNSQFHSIYFPYYASCYEPDVFAAIDHFLPNQGVFVDIGSNWGHHTFIAAIEKNAKVYAFEPNEEVYGDLVSIATDLNCQSQISAYNLGVGAKAASFDLVQSQFESGVASVSDEFLKGRLFTVRWPQRLLDTLTFNSPISRSVNIVSIDSVIPTDVKVDLVKIDAEGAELDCLKGMRSTLARSDVKVLFELHTDPSGDFSQYAQFFSDLHYKIYEIHCDLSKQTCSFRLAEKLKPCTQYNLLASKAEIELFWFLR